MTEYNCSERLAIVAKFSYNYDNSNIKKENNMSVNESQIKNTTAGGCSYICKRQKDEGSRHH